jgi:hypothetical protein
MPAQQVAAVSRPIALGHRHVGVHGSCLPFKGSAIVYSDTGPLRRDPSDPKETIGTAPPPLHDVPNRAGEDPHAAPRGVPAAEAIANAFLAPRGRIINPCGSAPCYAGGFTGP